MSRFWSPVVKTLTPYVFVFGALTDWNVNGPGRMQYNADINAYEGFLKLKQGYYNYQYVFVSDSTLSIDETVFEGSHYESENDYTIYIYDRPFAVRYDKLIGIYKLNTLKGF